MKKIFSKAPKGAIVAEVFLLRGARTAEKAARLIGAHQIAEAIRFGDFRPRSGPFTAARAQARAAAVALIRQHKLA